MYIGQAQADLALGKTHSHQEAPRMQKALGHAAEQGLWFKSKFCGRITHSACVLNSTQVVFDGTFADKPCQGHVYLRNFL